MTKPKRTHFHAPRNFSVAQRLEYLSIPEPNSGCFLWLGSVTDFGYAKVNWFGTYDCAHRWAWRAAHGEIPEGLQVLHKCDVPSCVNPNHLFLGTHADNMRDKALKGRCNPTYGGGGKLDPDKVLYVRASKERGSDLAKKFGVSQATISETRTGKLWAWVK